MDITQQFFLPRILSFQMLIQKFLDLFLPHFVFSYTKSNNYSYVDFSVQCVPVDYMDKLATNHKMVLWIQQAFPSQCYNFQPCTLENLGYKTHLVRFAVKNQIILNKFLEQRILTKNLIYIFDFPTIYERLLIQAFLNQLFYIE